jgi:hypothetical protein
LDERGRDILSHIFGEAHADGELDKLVASVTKQAASQHREWSQPKAQDIPAADLRKMLSQCQRPDKPSVMINGVEYVVKLNNVMYQVSNHKQTTLPIALIDRGTNGGVTRSDTRKSPNPALNVRPRDEPVATNTIYSDTPAIDCGVTSAQLFVGTKTHTADVYPIKSDKQFVNTLLDNITQRGAPTKLISDRAQVEISERVKQVLRPLHISTWQSEPHQQHQNPAERQYQNIK